MVNVDEDLKSFVMNAEGCYSYKNNSYIQRDGTNRCKAIIEEAIAEKLDVELFSTSKGSFTIADLGCDNGPNTFIVVKNIVSAVEVKYKQRPEFHVYFNDHVANDFNMLFRSISSNKEYFMSGVPGSFSGRLFPRLLYTLCTALIHSIGFLWRQMGC